MIQPENNRPTEQIDFFGHKVVGPLPRIQTLRQDLEPILKLVTLYTKVLDQNGSVAKHLHMPLLSSRIEDRVNSLFSSSYPHVVDLADDDDCYGIRPSWVDVIQESEMIDQIDVNEEDPYRISVRGVLVEVSKSDWDMLSSNVLQRLLGTSPEPEDVQAEQGARNELIEDLIEFGEGISEIDGMIQTMLQALKEQTRTADRESTRSESSVPSVEIQMCDGDEIWNPVLDFDTTIDKDIGDHVRNMEASITPTSLETSTENNPKTSLKLASAWSPLEKRQLRNFVSTRGHLSWSRIALEYEAQFHRGRSASSIASQARCLGLSVGRKPSKKPTRTVRRDPLVLKVRVPPLSSSEGATSAGPVETLTGACSGEESPIASSECSHSLQDRPTCPVEFHTTSPYASSNSLFMLQSSEKKNHKNLRHSDPELPRSFGFILN